MVGHPEPCAADRRPNVGPIDRYAKQQYALLADPNDRGIDRLRFSGNLSGVRRHGECCYRQDQKRPDHPRSPAQNEPDRQTSVSVVVHGLGGIIMAGGMPAQSGQQGP